MQRVFEDEMSASTAHPAMVEPALPEESPDASLTQHNVRMESLFSAFNGIFMALAIV
jgi:hypothetical protein